MTDALAAWPIDPARLAPFLLAVALIELTPGPNMGWLALLSAARGRAAGLAAIAGITLGLTVYLAAALAGLTEVLLRYPAAYAVLRWAGVAFLLWLAWEAWSVPGAAGAIDPRDEGGLRGAFWRGLVANLLNPKAALFYIALLPGFIDNGRGPVVVQALILGLIHLGVSVLVHGAIVLGAARARRLLEAASRTRGPLVRGVSATSLVLIAAWLAWQTRG